MFFPRIDITGFKSARNPAWPIAAGILLRIVHLIAIAPSPVLRMLIIDSGYYHQKALEIASGEVLGSGVFFMSPFYYYLMGLLYVVVFPAPLVIAVFQILMSGAAIWLIWKITNELAGRTAAVYAAWAGALFPVWIYFDGMILTASTILLLNLTAVWFVFKWLNTGRTKYLLLSGFFIGLSILTRPSAILFVMGILIWLGIQKKYKPGAYFLGIVLLVLLPVTLRNIMVTGERALTTASGGMNFFVGNNPQATGLYYEPEFLRSAEPEFEFLDYIEKAEKVSLRKLSAVEASRFWYKTGLLYIAEHPADALKLYWRKFFYFWNNLEAPNNVSYYLVEKYSPLLRVMFWGFGLVGALGLAGLIICRSSDKMAVLWIYLGSILLANLIFFTSSEFRFASVAALLPGFGIFLAKTAESVKGRNYDWKSISLAVVFLFFSHYHTPSASGLSSPRMDYYNYGSVAIAQGDYRQAIDYLQMALEEDPGFMQGHMALGTAFLELEEYSKAAAEFRLAGYVITPAELERQSKERNNSEF